MIPGELGEVIEAGGVGAVSEVGETENGVGETAREAGDARDLSTLRRIRDKWNVVSTLSDHACAHPSTIAVRVPTSSYFAAPDNTC